MNPGDKRLLLGIAALILVLLLAVAAIVGPKLYDWAVDATAHAIVDAEDALKPDPREAPSLFDVRIEGRLGREHLTVAGTVRNNGPTPISFVEIRCAIVDLEGLESDAAITYGVGPEGLPPATRRDFDLILDRPPGELWEYSARCEIVDYRP